ncbi:MAG: sulfotransferase family 2 domain-containing protein [Pseudomonadota bacterium]
MNTNILNRAQRGVHRLKASFGPRWKERICFLHLPKCAGNSLIRALHAACPLHRRASWITVRETRAAIAAQSGDAPDDYHEDGPFAQALFDYRLEILSHHLKRKHQVISGHFLYPYTLSQPVLSEFSWITIVRDPVERMISHYREEARSGFTNAPFTDYLKTDLAYQHSNVLTRYLSGSARMVPEDELGAVAKAKEHLHRFALIGDLNDMQTFTARLEQLIGRTLDLQHERPAAYPMPELTTEIEERVHLMCKSDIEVYTHARKLIAT